MTPTSAIVAVIGAGAMAEQHISAFVDIPGVEVAGIHSRTRPKADRLAEEFGISKVCDSVAELYHKTSADLLVVAVSVLSVRDVCAEAFQFPWTCLIEKPVGYDLAEAEEIAAEACKLGRQAFVALNRRHYSSTKAVTADLAEDGEPRLIHVQDQEDLSAAVASGQPEQVVQNWMYANSIHLVDYLRVFGRGEVTSVQPIIRWDPELPRFVVAKVTFSSGDIGLYEAIWNGPGPWAVTVTTQTKRWELRPLEQAAYQPRGSRKLQPVALHEWDTSFKPGFRAQAEAAVRAVKGQANGLPSLEEALASMRLVHQIYA